MKFVTQYSQAPEMVTRTVTGDTNLCKEFFTHQASPSAFRFWLDNGRPSNSSHVCNIGDRSAALLLQPDENDTSEGAANAQTFSSSPGALMQEQCSANCMSLRLSKSTGVASHSSTEL